MLLTRLPLSTHRSVLLVRLACVRPAASIRSEPGSNSQVQILKTTLDFNITKLTRVWFVKDKQVQRYKSNMSAFNKSFGPLCQTILPRRLHISSNFLQCQRSTLHPQRRRKKPPGEEPSVAQTVYFVEQTSNITPEVLAASIRSVAAPKRCVLYGRGSGLSTRI